MIATLAVSRLARADRWYGWKLYPSDAVATTAVVIGARSDNGTVILAGTAIYLLVPPIIHLVEGEDRRARKSLGMRVGFPLVVFVITGGNALKHGEEDLNNNVVLPTVVTGVLVALVDSMLAETDDSGEPARVYLQLGGEF